MEIQHVALQLKAFHVYEAGGIPRQSGGSLGLAIFEILIHILILLFGATNRSMPGSRIDKMKITAAAPLYTLLPLLIERGCNCNIAS